METPSFLPSPTSLIAACCRWPLSDQDDELITSEIAKIGDWDALLESAMQHRVLVQVLEVLDGRSGVPTAFLDRLKLTALQCRKLGLQQLAELQRLDNLLSSHKICYAELKGMTLGELAYGRTDLKVSIDIDLFVAEGDVQQAVSLLLANGYRHNKAGTQISARQIKALMHSRKDLPLSGPDGLQLELHWRLSQATSLLKGIGEPTGWQDVTLPNGIQIKTLSKPDLVAFLAVHGALSDWERLKWLADLNALIAKSSVEEIRGFLAHADKAGAGKTLRFAFVLCRDLLGREQLLGLDDLDCDPSLLEAGAASIHAGYTPKSNAFGDRARLLRANLRNHSQLFNSVFGRREIVRPFIFVEADLLAFPLPRALRYLYPLIRIPHWLFTRNH